MPTSLTLPLLLAGTFAIAAANAAAARDMDATDNASRIGAPTGAASAIPSLAPAGPSRFTGCWRSLEKSSLATLCISGALPRQLVLYDAKKARGRRALSCRSQTGWSSVGPGGRSMYAVLPRKPAGCRVGRKRFDLARRTISCRLVGRRGLKCDTTVFSPDGVTVWMIERGNDFIRVH